MTPGDEFDDPITEYELMVMASLASIKLKTVEQTIRWWQTPHPAFGNMRPWLAVMTGQAREVYDFLTLRTEEVTCE